ncbi:uncharacterized protein LOC111049637 [Nilaparvata lugens]|uniref:uncharacterized protein LOC111049637 n=1 Tax=Nilaparvata lugens TaxID=108931 RepID=UPI00193D2691|nr:uncharacterized protein LOC111049637 [Nilaparvata lugens]
MKNLKACHRAHNMFEVIFSMRIRSKMKMQFISCIIITLLLTTIVQVQGTKIYEANTCTPVCWTDFIQRNDAPLMLQEMIQTISTYGPESPQMAMLLQTLITETETIRNEPNVVMDTEVVEIVETVEEIVPLPVLGNENVIETTTVVITDRAPLLEPIIFQPPPLNPELIEAAPVYIEELITNQELECDIPPAQLNDFLSKVFTLSDTTFFEIPLTGSSFMSLSSSSSSEEELITEMVVNRKQTTITKNRIVLKKKILRYLKQVIEQKALPTEMMDKLVDYIDYLSQDVIDQKDEIIETIYEQDISQIVIQEPVVDPSYLDMHFTEVSVQNYVTGLLSNPNLVSDLPQDELAFIMNQVLSGSDTAFLDTLPLVDTVTYETEVTDIESFIPEEDIIVETEEIDITVTRPVVVDYLQQIINKGTLPIDLINRLYGYVEFMTKGDPSAVNHDSFVPLALDADILVMLPSYIDEIVSDPLLMPSIPTDERRMVLNQIFTGTDLSFYEALPESITTSTTITTYEVLENSDPVIQDVRIVKKKKQRKSKKSKFSKKRIIKYLQQVIEKKALPSEMLTRLSDYLDFIHEDGQYTRTITETVTEETIEEKPKGKFSLAITGIDAVDIVKPVGKSLDKLTLKLNGGGMKGLIEKLGSFSDSSEETKIASTPDFKFSFPFDESYLSSMYPNVDFQGMVTKYLAGEKEIENELFETPLAELDLEEKKIAENAEILHDNWMDVVGELGLLMKSEKDIDGVDQLTTILKDLQAYVPQQSINAADNLSMKKIKKILQNLSDFVTGHPSLKNVKKYGDIVKGLKTNLKFSEKFFKKVKSISIKRSSIRKIVNKKKYSTVMEKVQEKLKSIPEILKQESSVIGNVFSRIMNDLENFMAWKPSDVIQDSYTKLLSRMHDFMNEVTTGDVDIDSYNGELMNEIELYMKEEVNPRNLASYLVVDPEQSTSTTYLESLEVIPEFIVEEGFNVEFIDEVETCSRLISELEALIESRTTSVYSFKYKKIITKLTKYIQNLKQYGVNAVCPEEYQLALQDLEKYIVNDPTIVTPDRYLKLISNINYNIDMISYDTVDVNPFIERSVDFLESFFEANPTIVKNEVSVKIIKIRKFMRSIKRFGIRSVNVKQYSEIIQELVGDITQNESYVEDTSEVTYFLNQISDYIETPNYVIHSVDPNFVKLISDVEYFLTTNTEIKISKYTKYITTLYKFVHEVERFGLETVDLGLYKIEVEEFINEIREDILIPDENSQIFVFLINEINEQIENPLMGTHEIDPFIEKSITEIDSFIHQKDVTKVLKYYKHVFKLRKYVTSVKKFGIQAVEHEDYYEMLNGFVEEVKEDEVFENPEVFENLVSETSSFIVDTSYGLHEVDPFISRSISTLESYFLSEPRADFSKYSAHITKIYKYISEVKRFGMEAVDTEGYISILEEINQEIFNDMSIDDIDKYTHIIGQVTGYLKESSKIESLKSVDPFIERSINMLESLIESDAKILHTTRYKKIITKIYKYISDVRVYGIESVDLNSYQTVLNQFVQYVSSDPSIENSEQYTGLVNEISDYILDTSYGTYEFDPFVEKSIVELENYLQVSSTVVYKKKYSKIIRKLYKHVSNVKRYGSSSVDTEDYQRIIAELQAEIALDENIEQDCAEYLGLVEEISELSQDKQVFEYVPVDPFIERAIVELEKYLQTSSGVAYTTKYSIHITKMYKYISDWRRFGVTEIDHEYYMKTLSELMESVHEDLDSDTSKTCIDLILQVADYFDTPTYVSHDLDSYKILVSDFENYLTTDPQIENGVILNPISKLNTYVTEVKTFGKSSVPVENYRSVLTDLEKQVINNLDVETQKPYIDLISQISVHFEDTTVTCVEDNLDPYKMVVTELEITLRSDPRIQYTTSISLLVTKLHKYISDVKRYGLGSVDTGHYVEVITELSNELFPLLDGGDLEIYTEIFNQIYSYFGTPSYVSYDLDEYSTLVTNLDNFFQQEAKIVYTKKTTTLIKKLYKYTSVVKKYGLGAVDVDSYRVLINELQNEVSNLDPTVDTSKFTELTSEIITYFEPTTVEPQELNSYKTLISNFETVFQASTSNLSPKFTLLLKKLHKYTSDIERYGINAVDVAYYQSILSELDSEITKDTTLVDCDILKDYITQIQQVYDPNDGETNEIGLYRMLVSELETVLGHSKKSTEYTTILKKLTKYISDVKRFGVVSLDNEHYARLVQQLNNLIISDEAIDVEVTTDLVKQLEGYFVTPDYVSIDFEPYCNLVTELENVFAGDTSVVYATKYSLKITKLKKFVKRIKKYGVKAVDMTQYKQLLTSLTDEIITDPEIESTSEYTSMISQISTYFDPPPTTNIVNTVDPFQELVSDLETYIKQEPKLTKSSKISILIQKLFKYSADVKSFGPTAVDLQYYQDIVTQFNKELELETHLDDKEQYQDMISQISDYFGVPTYVTYNSDPYSSVISEIETYVKQLPSHEIYLEPLTKLQKYSSDVVAYGKNNIDNNYYQLLVTQMWSTLTADPQIQNLEIFEDLISEISDYFDTSCHVEFNLDPYKQAVTELETYMQKTTIKTTTKKTSIKRTTLIKKLYRYINDVDTYGIESVDPDHYNTILHELEEDLGLDEVVDEGYTNLISQISEYFVTPSYVNYDLQPYTDVITKLEAYLSTGSNDLYVKKYSAHLEKLSIFTTEAKKYGIGVVDTNAYSFTLSQLQNELENDGVFPDSTIYEGFINELSSYFETDQNLSNLDQYTSLINEIEDRFQTGHTVLFTKKYSKYVRKLRKYVVDVRKYGIKYVDPKYFNTVLEEMMTEVSADPEIEDVVWYENNVSQLNELLVIPEYETFNEDPYETLITNLDDALSSSSTVTKVVYSRKYSLKIKKLRKYSKIVKKYGISAVDSQYYNGLLTEIKSDIDRTVEASENLSEIFSDISTYIETPSFFLHTSDPFTTLLTELEELINTEINVFQAPKYYPIIKNLFGYISQVKQFGLKVLDNSDYYQDLMTLQKMLSQEPKNNGFGKYSTLIMLISKAFDDTCGVLPDSELLINLLFDVENHISEETHITNHNQYFTTIGNLYDFLLDVHLFGTQGVNRNLYRNMVTQVSNVISSDANIRNQHTYIGTLSRVSTYLTCSSLFPYSTENFRSLMGKLEELISREPKLIFRYKYLPIIYDLYNYIPDFQYLGTEGTRSEHYRNILSEFRASIAIEPNLLDSDIYFEVIEDIFEEIDRPFHFSREVKPFMKLIGEMEKVIELEPDLVNTIYYRKHLLKLRHYISHRHAVKNLDLELDYISVIVDDVVKVMSTEPKVLDQTTFDRLVFRLRKHVKVSKKSRLAIPLDSADTATIEEIEEFVLKTTTNTLPDSFLEDDRLAMELGLSATKPDPNLETVDNVDPFLSDISGLSPNSERSKLLAMIKTLSKPGAVSSPDVLLKLTDYYRSKFGELDGVVGDNLLSFGEPNLILDDDFGGSFGGTPMYGGLGGNPMGLGGTPMSLGANFPMEDPSFLFNNPVIIQPVPVFVSGPLPGEPTPEIDPTSFLSVMGDETIAKLIPPNDNWESYTLHIEGIDTLEQLEALKAAVERNGLLIAGLDTMAVEAPPTEAENFDGYMGLDEVAAMYAEMTAKVELVEEILDTEYELVSDLQIENEITDLEEATAFIEQEVIALPPHLRPLVEPMVLRKSTHFISMNTVFGGGRDVIPLLGDRFMSVFGEYVVYYD